MSGMKKMMSILLTMALASALSACGAAEPSDDSDKNAGGSTVTADEELVIHASNYKFDKEEYHLSQGKTVKITLKSQGMHGIEIDGLGVSLKRNNASTTVTLDKPGTYEIICNIVCGSGHRDMVAKLVVE